MAPETSGGFKVIDPQDAVICWLLASDEPWTRYRTRLDLLGEPEDAPAVQAERAAMLAHPQVLHGRQQAGRNVLRRAAHRQQQRVALLSQCPAGMLLQ